MEDIDVRSVLNKFIQKWPLFVVSLVIALLIAFVYMQSAEKMYQVQASVQLKEQNPNENGGKTEKFINGLELLESHSALEDEIGILSSYSTVKQSIEKLEYYTNIYRSDIYSSTTYSSNRLLKAVDWLFAEEIYKENISIQLARANPQMIDVPIRVSFIDKNTFLVEAEASDVYLYNFQSHQSAGSKSEITLSKKGTVGKPFVSPFLSFTLMPVGNNTDYWNNRYYFVNRSLKDVAEEYQHKLRVAPIVEKANIVTLVLQGPVAEKESSFLNTLANTYVENDLRKRNQLGLKTIDFIDKQLTQVSDTLRGVDGKLEKFRANSNVIDVGVSAQTLTVLLNELEEKQIERKTQNEYFRYLSGYLSRNTALGSIVAPSTAGIVDPTLTKLLDDLNALSKERVSVVYNSTGENNPVLSILDRKIENTKKLLAEDISNLVRSTNITINENQRRINQVKQQISQLPQNERNLNTIQRKFRLNDDVYRYLLEKRAEASIAIASSAPDKDIIDMARQVGNKPVSPKPSLVYLMAVLLGFILPAGFLSLRDYVDKRVEGEDLLEKEVRIPVIASIVRDQIKKYRPITANPFNDNAFQAIRHYLRFRNQRIIGVTSMASNEGKTYCAINLAVAFAKAGHKTLLIDTDFYKSDTSTVFNLDRNVGLIDALPDENKLTINQTSVEHLDIVGAGQASQLSRSIFLQHSLEQLFEKLKKEYAYIIVDTCPVGLISDYLLFSSYIDYTLFVVRDNVSDWKDVGRLNKLLTSHNLRENSAIIYNAAKISRASDNYYKKMAG